MDRPPNSSRRERGQASVELVGLAPALCLLAACLWQGLVAGWALVEVQGAARAGARALLADEQPRSAVEAALPGPLRADLRLERSDHRLRVSVVVPSIVPGLRLRVPASVPVVAQ